MCLTGLRGFSCGFGCLTGFRFKKAFKWKKKKKNKAKQTTKPRFHRWGEERECVRVRESVCECVAVSVYGAQHVRRFAYERSVCDCLSCARSCDGVSLDRFAGSSPLRYGMSWFSKKNKSTNKSTGCEESVSASEEEGRR